MKVPWSDDRCIVCLEHDALTIEHIIPKSIGGILTSKLLCKKCNSVLGAGFEAKARLSPELRISASAGSHDIAVLRGKLEFGAFYRSKFGNSFGEQKMRGDGSIGEAKLSDGSIVVPEEYAARRIRSMLAKRGGTSAEMDMAVRLWSDAPSGETVDLGRNIVVRKWNNQPWSPVYSEEPMSSLVPLKSAYEFCALLLGSAVYQDAPGLMRIRGTLLRQDSYEGAALVSARIAKSDRVFHGIAFIGNLPEAKFQVRFFGRRAYVVEFPGLQIDCEPICYTHHLETGDEWVSTLSTSQPSSAFR